MIAAILLFACLHQTDARPNTLPPLIELHDKTSVVGPGDSLIFDPGLGGLLITGDGGWDVSQIRTSDAGLRVNLRTAELNYVSPPDIVDRQIVCPSGIFLRSYRSELAKLGKHSPGLPVGWVHNYDVILKPGTATDKWSPLILTYPNKSQEIIEPEMDDQGNPTGKGISKSNATYSITYEPGATVNEYKSVDILWPKSGIHWTFEPHESGVMVLALITQTTPQLGSVRLTYGPDRTLQTVTGVGLNMQLFKFDYSGGCISMITGRGTSVVYGYNQLNSLTVLWKVSDPFFPSDTPKDHYVYSYATELPYPALAQIAIPDGAKWSKSSIEYTGGHITAVQGSSGVRQEVGPPQGR